jgi:hypothetical protein
MLPIKKNFSLPLFGVYLIFFVFFNNFGKRIKECYFTKEDRVSQTYYFQAHRTHGFSGKRDICKKRTLGKNPPGAKGVKM